MKILMRLLAVGFYFDRLEDKYFSQPKSSLTLVLLMQRCVKLHNTLDHIYACFKLLKR